MLRVGIISDTHDLLRPQAKAFLQGCDRIIHAGDVNSVGILEDLATLAPVIAVRGNNDRGTWAEGLCETELVELDGVLVCVIHDLARLDIVPGVAGVRVVVSGHSHKPSIVDRDGILFINPGSAGPRRFKLPVAVAELAIAGGTVSARIVELAV
jgi:putative phosphoesterase